MEEQTLLPLIDQYLLGTISSGDKATLEQLMASDASIAATVNESREAFKVLQHARKLQLKEKLRELDKDDLNRQGFFNNRIGLIVICVACILIGGYLASIYYNPSGVARRNFIDFTVPTGSGASNDQMVTLWVDAKSAFFEGDYEKAIQHYQALSELGDPTASYTARWNMLLAQLALDGVTPGWQMALEVYVREAPEPFASRANKLSGLLNSGFRKVFIMHLQEDISTIRPRII